MRLSDLLVSNTLMTLNYHGMTVLLTVRSNLLTSSMFSTLAKMGVKTEDPATVAAQLDAIPAIVCKLVASWDFEDEEGAPFPLDPEELANRVPFEFLSAVLAAVTGSVGEATAPEPISRNGASGAGSLTLISPTP